MDKWINGEGERHRGRGADGEGHRGIEGERDKMRQNFQTLVQMYD